MSTSQTVEQVKQDLISGVRASACQACWTLEDQGLISRRQQENSFLDYKLDQDIDNIERHCRENFNIDPVLYQLTVSNICNQACVSCGSFASTKWAEVERKMGKVPYPLFQIDLPRQNINFSTVKRIALLGGEPLYNSQTFEILQQLLDHNNRDCFVSLITNGSVELDQSQTSLLSKFTDLNICVSVDGVGPVFEYLRWPGKWSTVVNNIADYKKISKTFSISYTISAVNVLYHQQTVDWFRRNNFAYNHNIVTGPRWLDPMYMPVSIKKHLPNDDFFRNWKAENGSEYSSDEFVKKLQSQDVVKKIFYQDYLPELAKVISNQ